MIHSITAKYLNQLKIVIQTLDDSQFSKKLTSLSHASIGMHARHIVEFYSCLLENASSKQLNYDCRKRDTLIETERKVCISNINKILEALHNNQYDYALKLSVNYSTDKDHQTLQIDSTFFRELVYNIEHVIHHLAIIKIGVQALDINLKLPEDFGVAASTIRSRKACVQ